MTSFTYAHRSLDLLRYAFDSCLGPDSPCIEPPANSLTVTLRAHQQAVLYKMEQMEQQLLNGMDCSGETFFSSYGILGDSVGVGKSLMVMGHIARLEQIPPLRVQRTLSSYSSACAFSLREQTFQDVSEAGCLLVVPHTLFRQWADYIKKQSRLRALFLEKKKAMTVETFAQDVRAAQVVLVSNTLFKEFSYWARDQQITWKRVFYDEADTIHIVSTCPAPKARFTWFITASWMNMIFPNETIYISQNQLSSLVFSQESPFKTLRPFFQESYTSARPYHYFRHYVTSIGFLRNWLSSDHPLRYKLIIKCSEEFIKQSISLPPLTRTNITCKAPIAQRIIGEIVPGEVQQLLHGGDTAGAIAALGLKTEDVTSIIDAVTKNLQKEMTRLRHTYEFKSTLEYSSSSAKEQALKTLEEKMKRTEESIKAIQSRIEGFKDEMCPICYDEPQEAVLTPCCSRVFCGGCILQCLTRNPTCPMCRTAVKLKDLRKVVLSKTEIVESGTSEPVTPEEGEILKKPETLLRLFRENPEGRFLVFSRYDYPFTSIESQIESLGVKVKQLKGNKDAIAATLKAFQTGALRCLLLNSHYAGSGLNITAATHVILFHAMTHEEEKQILGRAYRMGRTEPLTFIRLLHPDEMVTTN